MAQEGEIRGAVVDLAGAPLPGASVTLSGAGLGATREALADARGRFVFTRLAPGTYVLGVSLGGFRPVTVEGVALADEPVVGLGAITLHPLFLIDPVVVTATRFVEPLGRVPMSIAAVGGVDLERRAIGTLTELARWAPGLTVVDQGARGSNVVIARGLHTDALTGSEQAGNNYNNGVATYLGDVPLAIDLRLRDIERVEVLLGPQGTLYGAGALAGAVRYLPRRPRTARRTLEFRGDLFGLAHSDRAGSDAGLTINLPLVPGRLAVRGSLDRYSHPGFIDYDYVLRMPGVSEPEPSPSSPQAASAHLRSEPDANTETTVSGRLSLLWQPTPTLGALLAYHVQDQSVGARQVNHARSFGTGRYVAAHRYLEPNDRRNQLWSLELSWALPGADVTAAVGYSSFEAEGQRDQTDLLIQEFGIAGLLPSDFPALARARAADPDVSATEVTSAFRAFSAYTRESSTEERLNLETRVASRDAGPWRWVGGVFFNRYESRGTSHEFVPGLTEFSGVTPVLGGSAVAEPIEYYSLGTGLVEERAVFGEVSRDLGEGWRLTAGGRGFSYRIETGNLTEFPYTPLYNSPFTDYASDDRGMLLKASVSYRVGEETTAYVTRSEGYRIGGSNNFRVCTEEEITLLADNDPTNDPPQSGCIYADQVLVRPDVTTNYEVGVRRSWADGRFRVSTTLFHVDWRDIQVAGLTPFSAQPITLNGAGAVSRGIELAGAAAPAEGLRLSGSWSYTKAELSQDSHGLLEGGTDAFRGDRLSGAPQHQGSVLASWARPLGASAALEVLYGYTYVGDVLTRVGLRADGERLSAYELHNASASVSRGAWTLTLYAVNLLNEYAVTGVRQTPGQIGLTEDGFRSRRYFHNVLTPRRVGVRVGYAFGRD